MSCPLCKEPGGEWVWGDDRLRVVRVEEPGYPGFCRVIWNAHVREMTDLAPEDRQHFMRVVFAVEAVLRAEMQPLKINLASLGNLVPHLHWHVIPRFADDPHFPSPVWAPPRRAGAVRTAPTAAALARALEALLQSP